MSLIDIIKIFLQRIIDKIYSRFDEKVFEKCSEAAKELLKIILDILYSDWIKKEGGKIEEFFEEYNKIIKKLKEQKTIPNAEYKGIGILLGKIGTIRCSV